MSFITETLFEVAIPDGLKNVSGKFGNITDGKFVPTDCSAGTLCVQHSLTDNEGYEGAGYKNGNDWNFTPATDGKVGYGSGDATGIFAFNNYARNRAVDGNGNVWIEGRNTLGIGLPAGERGDFREITIGKQYFFGKGDFATAPSSEGHIYATIQNGRLVATATKPTTGGEVYFDIIATAGVTEGSSNWGTKYRVIAKRVPVTAAAPAQSGN